MSCENKAESLTDFAELVLRLTEEERIEMLNKHYEEKESKLKDILVVPHSSVSKESVSSSRKSQGKLDT